MSDQPPTIVIDNGSYELRAGHPEDEAPRVAIPAVVGQPLNAGVAMAAGLREYEIGFEARAKRGVLMCSDPVHSGIITNWDAIEKLWAQVIFRELRVVPENYTFVITEPPNAPKEQKEKTLELLMETFNANSLYLGVSSVFSLYSYGKTTGVAVDVGLHNASATPIHEGYCLTRQVTTTQVAGQALTLFLTKLLKDQGYGFGTTLEQEMINSVKERLCYVMPNHRVNLGNMRSVNQSGNTSKGFGGTSSYGGPFSGTQDDSAAQAQEEEYVPPAGPEYFSLPDGQQIPLGEERHLCPEALFNFSILGEEHIPRAKVFCDNGSEYSPSIDKGLSWLAYAAINSSEPVLQPSLINNVVLAGGSSLFRGTRTRIQRELQHFYREVRPNEGMIPISVDEIACREHCAWLGGCMLSSISMFKHLTVNRQEYEEQGLRVIHCKNL